MPRLSTLLTMRNRVRSITDQEQSVFVSDAEIDDWINQGVAEAWRQLVTADSNRGITSSTLSTTAGTTEYALPADFMAFRGLDYPLGGGRYDDVHPYAFAERNQLEGHSFAGPGAPCRYLILRGNVDNSSVRISLLPDPGTHAYRLWYVTNPSLLVTPSQSFDGIVGFEDFAVYHAAIEVRGKAEEDPSKEILQLQKVEQRILQEAPRRHRTGVETVARVRHRGSSRFPY